MKRYKKIFYFTLVIAVLFTLIISRKQFLLVILSALGLCFRSSIKEKEKEVEEKITTQHLRQIDLRDRTNKLKYRFDQWQKSSKARRTGRLKNLILLIILATFWVMTSAPVLAANDLYIPESYEELRELYILADQEIWERDELIREYQVLVEDYENLLRELKMLIKRLQEISEEKDLTIAAQEQIITLHKKPTWGITGGLTVSGELGYNLGIIRLRDWWGWQINYSPSGSLFLGLSIYL